MKVDLDEYECPICGSPNVTLAIRKTTKEWVIETVYCNDGAHVWRCELD